MDLKRVTQADLDEGIGLTIDMTYADRLREWARLLLIYGTDISQWESVPFVVSTMQTMATDIEKAIRDIGRLRAALASSSSAEPGHNCWWCGKAIGGERGPGFCNDDQTVLMHFKCAEDVMGNYQLAPPSSGEGTDQPKEPR